MRRHTILAALLIFLVPSAPTNAPAQTAVSPSEAAAYFDDLRSHARLRHQRVRHFQAARTSGARSELRRGTRTTQDIRRAAFLRAQRSTSPAQPHTLETLVTERLLRSRFHHERISRHDGAAPTHPDARVDGSRYRRSTTPGGRIESGVPGRRGHFSDRSTNRLRPDYFTRGRYGQDGGYDGRSNVRIGPVDVRVGTSTFVEYNDNILRSGTEKLSDVIIGQTLDLHARWQLSQNNRLDLQVGAGVERYLQHHDRAPTSQDGYDLYVTPDSLVSYDVFLGDMVLNLHNRFSVKNGGRSDFTLDDLNVVNSYANAAGAALFVPLGSRVDASVGYDYYLSRALDSRDAAIDQNSHQLFADLGYSPGGTWRAGLQASASFTDFLAPSRADADVRNFGAYLELPLSRFTTLRASGGHQRIALKNLPGAPPDFSGTYGEISLTNQLNRFVSHALTAGRQTDLGTFSDVRTTDYVRYQLSYEGRTGDHLTLSLAYEDADDRGASSQSGSPLANSLPVLEDRRQLSGRVFYRRPLSRNLRAAVFGTYTDSSTTLPGRSYRTWSAGASLEYALSDTLSAGAGYTYRRTSAAAGQGYAQNRFILNLNYLF